MPGPIRHTRSPPRPQRQSLSVVNGDAHHVHQVKTESRVTRSSTKRMSVDSESDSSTDCSGSSLTPPPPPPPARSPAPPSHRQIALVRENKRKEALLSDPNIIHDSVTATSVRCRRCTASVHLDKRGTRTYYASNWKRHIDACLLKTPESTGINFLQGEWSVSLPLPHGPHTLATSSIPTSVSCPTDTIVHFYTPTM